MHEVFLNENFDSSHACLNTGRQENVSCSAELPHLAEIYSRKSDVFRHNLRVLKQKHMSIHSNLLNLDESCINNCSPVPFSQSE